MSIPISNIYYLLSYSWNQLETSERIQIDGDDYHDSMNLLAHVFIQGTRHVLKKGVAKAYIAREEEYAGVKGKLLFNQSLRKQLFDQGKAVCTYDDFSPNVLLNQIVKSVLRKLTRFKELDRKLEGLAWDCFYRFKDVEEIDVQLRDVHAVHIHRNTSEYLILMQVAQLILENTVLHERDGSFTFSDFVRNERSMARLFEKFVFNFYGQEQTRFNVRSEDIRWQAKPLTDSGLRLLPKMQTDITLEAKDHKLIIDTKYYKETFNTRFDSEKLNASNLYQLHAYLTNLEKDASNPNNVTCEGILLYPTTQREVSASYQIGAHKMSVYTVDLSMDWRHIHTRLLDIIGVPVL